MAGPLSPSIYTHSASSTKSLHHAEFVGGLDRYRIVAETLYTHASRLGLVGPSGVAHGAVYLRVQQDEYIVWPEILSQEQDGFASSISQLHVDCAMRIESSSISALLARCTDMQLAAIPLSDQAQVQVLNSLADLSSARQNQGSAFVKESNCLIVWSNDPLTLVTDSERLIHLILHSVWSGHHGVLQRAAIVERNSESLLQTSSDKEQKSEEESNLTYTCTPMLVPFGTSLGVLVIVVMFGIFLITLLRQCWTDGQWQRMALLATLPFIVLFTMFFVNCCVTNVLMLLGPVRSTKTNSRYFSAEPALRINTDLPHITVQCPVYKESLVGVINPTIQSILLAIQTYELQGGTASIFVNDDGMQLLDESSQELRRQYYRDNGIGWVARPPHGKDGYVRAGCFKKASNMNFCLNVSVRVEKLLEAAQRADDWTLENEEALYQYTLQQICASDPKVWADGNIRVGDIILLVDSDTRVPKDCFLDAASEFYHSPELAILQHSSGVMHVTQDYWESLIGWFTELVYHSVRMVTANGDVAPFVGHNAFLRWSAMQEAAKSRSRNDEYVLFWSESHVSEDFELSLKLHQLGYVLRYAVYSPGFLEGVSLRVSDEISRWKKYAYGCSELIFHPVHKWLWCGPFTRRFCHFLCSRGLPGYSKWNIMAYIGTYFALGSSWIMAITDFFLNGWYSQQLDKTYLGSWRLMISSIVVFGGVSSIVTALTYYRLGEKSLLRAFVAFVKYLVPMLMLFTGLSFHISMALLSHLLGVQVEWQMTYEIR